MAELEEVLDTIELLVDANLSFPPKDIRSTARVWSALLRDIPINILNQAALDYILTGKDFPKLSEIRKAAEEVKIHNNTSAAPNPFKPIAEPVIHWQAAGIKDRVTFPVDVAAEIKRLVDKYPETGDRLPDDEELALIDALTEPYRRA